ncbi:MAG: hypothetical protein JWO12_3255 [Frankiales bacterium]|nr:hypothetical protein [Frankiales bacterium]
MPRALRLRRSQRRVRNRQPAARTASIVVTAALTSGVLVGFPGTALAAQNSLVLPGGGP